MSLKALANRLRYGLPDPALSHVLTATTNQTPTHDPDPKLTGETVRRMIALVEESLAPVMNERLFEIPLHRQIPIDTDAVLFEPVYYPRRWL